MNDSERKTKKINNISLVSKHATHIWTKIQAYEQECWTIKHEAQAHEFAKKS
jgi:hypothetical protein